MLKRVAYAVCLSILLPLTAHANTSTLNVLACEPEWAALAVTLGGDSVNVHSATTYQQDPHHIQARPSLIAKARRADVLICSGAELEVGWLPVLLKKSGNPKIQLGKPGHFMATDYVRLLGKRERVDRSEGDVHASGNPHVHLEPERMKIISAHFAQRLAQLLPTHRENIEANHAKLVQAIDSALQPLQASIEQLKGTTWIVHHDNWSYLFEWLHLDKLAELEPKPGVPPSTGHLSQLLKQLEGNDAAGIIYASYQDERPARWLRKRTDIPAVSLPLTIDNWQDHQAIPQFFTTLVETLSSTVK